MLYDDVRELQQMTAQIPARLGTTPAQPGDGIFQTIADPNNNYPQPANGGVPNVYYAVKCDASFDDEQGQQGFSPAPMSGNSNKKYICNVGDAYIGFGTFISCRQINGFYFTEMWGPQLWFGTTGNNVPLPGSPGYGTVPVTVNQIAGVNAGLVPFTCNFTMQSPYPIPNNWPVLGIYRGGVVWLVEQYPMTLPAYMQNYLPPFGIGTGVLLSIPNTWSNSTVSVVDMEGNGAQPLDQQIMLTYTNIDAGVFDGSVPSAGWIITSASGCNGEGF